MCWHYTGQFASTDKDFWGFLFGGKKNLIDVTFFLRTLFIGLQPIIVIILA